MRCEREAPPMQDPASTPPAAPSAALSEGGLVETSEPSLLAQAGFTGLEPELHAELATFEAFFKTFGFKRIHGRVWGLLVLSGCPLSAKEIVHDLSIS